MTEQWYGFAEGNWQKRIDVRDFIQKNYTPYTGDESFLCPPTERTKELYARLQALFDEERARGGVLDDIWIKNGKSLSACRRTRR